ncbi:MAG: mechanosensitive ion channel [Planctomycetes bacterium]|nr:mechanosensitive ion channel [Planctomycetota bacterium]
MQLTRIVTASLSFLLTCALAGASPTPEPLSGGQGDGASPQAPERAEVAGENTPQGAVQTYLEACRDNRYEDAARYLDLANVPAAARAETGPLLAKKLKVVLDQTIWVDLDALSTDPRGRLDDDLPDDRELIGKLETARGGAAEIRMQRAPDGSIWRFSEATVARIPGLYAEFGYGRIGELLPGAFFDLRFLDVQLWQWLGLAVFAVLAFLSASLVVGAAQLVLKPIVARSKTDVDDQLLRLTTAPVRFALAVFLFATGGRWLHLAVPAQRFVDGLEKGLAFVAIAWLLVRSVDVFSRIVRSRFLRDGRTAAVAVLPLVEKSAKVALLALALIAMLQNIGFDVTGLIAGLGVGGLALALAAQKTVENLFGGVSLIVDQPVRVGDFCRFGEKVGTVEDVGMRSTRVRTLDRTLLSIPNSEFSQMQLENFAERDKIRFFTVLGLRYETTADQLRWVLAEIRKLLVGHSKVDPDPARVRFVGYGDYSLNLEIFAFVRTRDFNEYLGIQEDLLLRIMDIVGASGTGFAFPSQTMYLARDSGNDAERTRAAERTVERWRTDGELPFPDYGPQKLAEFDDTVEYPPRGSALEQRA